MEDVKGWGILIMIFLLFIVFGGGVGNGFFGRGCGNNNCYDTDRDVWGAERQQIIDSARTQFLIEQRTADSIAATNAMGNSINQKIDYYAYQDLRDQLSDAKAENIALKSQMYSNAQFGALNARLDKLDCQMIKRPPFWGCGVYPAGIAYPPETTTTATAGA